MAANKAEKSSKIPNKHFTHKDNLKSDDSEVIMPATPPRPAQLAEESQGGHTITLALRTPERLHLKPNLAPKITPLEEIKPTWQLPASTAPPSLGQAKARLKRKRQGILRYKEGQENRSISSVSLSQPRI